MYLALHISWNLSRLLWMSWNLTHFVGFWNWPYTSLSTEFILHHTCFTDLKHYQILHSLPLMCKNMTIMWDPGFSPKHSVFVDVSYLFIVNSIMELKSIRMNKTPSFKAAVHGDSSNNGLHWSDFFSFQDEHTVNVHTFYCSIYTPFTDTFRLFALKHELHWTQGDLEHSPKVRWIGEASGQCIQCIWCSSPCPRASLDLHLLFSRSESWSELGQRGLECGLMAPPPPQAGTLTTPPIPPPILHHPSPRTVLVPIEFSWCKGGFPSALLIASAWEY